MKLLYTDRAKEDLDMAFEWYEKQRRGLGFEFLDCVELSIKDIKMVVNAYQQLKNSFENITDEELLSIKDLLYW